MTNNSRIGLLTTMLLVLGVIFFLVAAVLLLVCLFAHNYALRVPSLFLALAALGSGVIRAILNLFRIG
ncbi:MAG: hypothetical protein FWH42_00470 [Dehalococcoidia bacterium]|nr:hypothetical protein [Dehalococcoidia bacterium]